MAHLESLVLLDPSPRSREALKFGFERAGYSVYATASTTDALGMAQTRSAQLLVAAVASAEGEDSFANEGLSMIGRLREEVATRELPVVVLGEPNVRDEALRAGADEFVARPAYIRDVLTLAKMAVAVRQDGDHEGVEGLLEEYELFFLVRALAVAGRSCVLELERGQRQGAIHFVKGEVTSARCGKMNGIAAFQHLLLWGEATLQLRFKSPTGERKMATTIEELLSQGAQFAREFEALARRVGGVQAVFRQEPRKALAERKQIPSEVLSLLKFFDGHRPLIDVVEDGPFKPLDTIKITFRLQELGAVRLVTQPQTGSPLTAQLAVRDWLLGTGREDEPRSTVTEAGRRAAEAQSIAEAHDTIQMPRLAPVDESAAPKQLIDDQPTAPRERLKGPSARNKSREAGSPARVLAKAPLAAVAPSATPLQDQTIRVEKLPFDPVAPAPNVTAPAPNKVRTRAPKSVSSEAKEGPGFDPVEEAFFAGEREHMKQTPAESFDDLDPIERSRPIPKRRWFNFGAKFMPSSPKSPKK